MGKRDSSSTRKSSKRKTSKLPSQKKKKSRRNKLKKARDVTNSVSSYSDDESKSLLSGSKSGYSSSSGDDHKTRKGRSRARGEAKSSRRKVRRRSSSVESNPKKRKRSKKDVKLRSRKKSRKSKRTRDVSLSSASEAQSHGSDSSEEREPRKKRGRSRESKKYRHDRSKVKIKTRISRSESPSCSYSRDSHHTDSMSHGEKELSPEYKSRRIRSVITVVRRQEEDLSEKDRYEEEMIYDRYDYPSSRSNDSNDGVSKNESTYYSNIALDKSEIGGNETSGKENPAEYDITDRSTHAGDPSPFYSTQEAKIERGDVSSVVSEPTQDLELLLRQKALENLRKFQVEKQRNLKTNVSLEGQSEINTNGTCSEISKKEKSNISALDVNVKIGSTSPTSGQETVLSNPVMKSRTSSQAQPSTGSGISPARSPSLTSSLNNNQAKGVVLGVSSSTGNEIEVSEASLEKIASEQQDQSKDNSQYEKKTMSVMRGGEMVQVSYKVYIPKKTPALHRRHLKR